MGESSYKTFILSGQSNMAGHGRVPDLPESLRFIPENVELFIAGQTYPFFDWGRFGPELTFAHHIANAWPDERILIIKFAVGASSLLAWAPQWSPAQAQITDNADMGALYRKLLSVLQAGIQGKKTELAGLVWMQGERDAKFLQAADNYAANFAELITHLRNDLNKSDLPIIYGQINPPPDRFPFVEMVRQAQEQYQKTDPTCVMIPTDDLGKCEDGLHYNSAGHLELGHRFARAFTNAREHYP